MTTQNPTTETSTQGVADLTLALSILLGSFATCVALAAYMASGRGTAALALVVFVAVVSVSCPVYYVVAKKRALRTTAQAA